MNTQSNFEADIFSRCFGIPRNNFIEVGLPRNDALVSYNENDKREIKNKLNIPYDKKIILYCPTFREYEKDENFGVVMTPPMNISKWESELGADFILLIRAHYEVSKLMHIEGNGFARNMTEYANLNDLFIASDILISDYSSVFFDYSITGKPMLYFTYDYEKYNNERGMYFDIREYISGGKTEDEIIDLIKALDITKETAKTIAFRDHFVNYYGNATRAAVDCIAEKIGMCE